MTNKGPSLPPSITKISLSLALGVVLAILAFFLWQRVAKTEFVQSEDERLTEVILSAMPTLLERWQEGDKEGHYTKKSWSCADIPFSPHIAPAFLKCQPRYLECWAKGEAGVPSFLTVTLGKQTYRVQLKNTFPGGHFGQWVTRVELGRPDLPPEGLLIDVEVEGLGHWPMILEHTCRDTFLPERVYSYGARSEKDRVNKELMWDNFERKIFIDKFLVTNADVELWDKKPIDLKRLALPATHLTRKEQEAYCASRGARRMEAHLWDAATMTPADLTRPNPEFIVKPWLPWTRDRRGTFFEEAVSNPNWRPTAAQCAQAYVYECRKQFVYQPHHTDNVAWSGIFQVMGGTAERVRNPLEPEFVQRLSSSELPAMANEHQLGRRGLAEGEAGFRCYREVFP